MDRNQAIEICRDRSRKPSAAREVLEWTLANPAPEMVHFILLLHVGAWAGQHGLGELTQEAIIRCGALDAEPLWLTLEGDWDHQRIAYAANAIATLDAWRPSRMQKILSEPVPFHIWGFAREHAGEFQLSDDTIARQEAWRIASHRDYDRSEVGRAKWRRKQSWPELLELLPKRQQHYAHQAGQGYGMTGGVLTEVFYRLRLAAPRVAQTVRPGMAHQEILGRLRWIPRLLPAELVEFYQLADGASSDGGLVPNYRFLPLEEAIEFHREGMEEGLMTATDFPIMEWNGDQWIAITCSRQPSATGKVTLFVVEDGRRRPLAKNLADFLEKVTQGFQAGRYRFDAAGTVVHLDPYSADTWP